jgi:GNAT superfamily N-acetyltransferase
MMPPQTDKIATRSRCRWVTSGGVEIDYQWRGAFDSIEVERLHAAGFERPVNPANDWWAQVTEHSLGWVLARDDTGVAVGFVNVAWDGGVHAFILDTVTAATHLRRGVGTRLIEVAASGARNANCEWLHVDFEDHLRAFYFDSCGFRPTNAGLIAL